MNSVHSRFIVILLFINLVTCFIIFTVIIWPNFYFGLTMLDYVILIITFIFLLGLHLFFYKKNKVIQVIYPFGIVIIFYSVLYFANII